MRPLPSKSASRSPALWGIVVGVVLLLGMAVLSMVYVSQRPAGVPRLAVDQDEINFGDVKLGTWVTATFELTNAGDAPLRFTESPYIEVVEGC